MHYILFYDYVEDIVARRRPFRDEHLALVRGYVERGEVLLGGAFADPVDGAAIVFRVEQRATVEDFVRYDPYVRNGLLRSWRIREWTVLLGAAL